MRRLLLAGVALAATTAAVWADEARVPSGMVQLSEAQLDSVTAAKRQRVRFDNGRLRIRGKGMKLDIRQTAIISQSADAIAINIIGGDCTGFCGAIATGGVNIAEIVQLAR